MDGSQAFLVLCNCRCGDNALVQLHIPIFRQIIVHSIDQSAISLVPFHGFSSVIKSLRVVLADPLESSQLFNFVLSFPPLQDLILSADKGHFIDNGNGSDGLSTIVLPSSLPIFTGSLVLSGRGAKHIARRLLLLLGGLRFRELTLACRCQEDILLTTALVEGCSYTLESLEITQLPICASIRHPHQCW